MYDEALKPEYESERGRWMCGRCHVPLEQIAVNTVYSHGGMQLRLPRCPVCGQTMIPKYVAEGPFKVIEKGIEETWNSVDQRPREH